MEIKKLELKYLYIRFSSYKSYHYSFLLLMKENEKEKSELFVLTYDMRNLNLQNIVELHSLHNVTIMTKLGLGPRGFEPPADRL